ncbi:hypothetical protein BH10BAC6_BH10BAC6_06800 [soil metagenome]
MTSLAIVLLLVGGCVVLPAQDQWRHKDSLWGEKYANAAVPVLTSNGHESIHSDSPVSFQTFLFRYLLTYSPGDEPRLLELPLNKYGYGDALFYPSSFGTVFTYWDGYNNNAHRIYVKHRDSTAWTEAFPGEMPGHVLYFTVVFDTAVIIGNVTTGDFFSHSSDFGKSWRSLDLGSLGSPSPTQGFRNAFSVSDSVIASWRMDGYREVDIKTANQSHPPLPEHTGIYARSGRRVLGSTVYTDDAHPARLFTSADSGATWSYIDTVTVANTGAVVTSDMADGKAFECTHIHRLGDSTFVLTTKGRQVVITTDAGLTWRACSGTITSDLTYWGLTHESYWFDLSDTVTLVGRGSELFTINLLQCTVSRLKLPLDAVRSVTMLKNGELIAPANPAVYSSLDTGRTWSMIPWPEGATWNESLSGSTNVSHAFINTVRAYGPDSADVYSVDCGQILRLYPGSNRRARVLAGDWFLSKLYYTSSNSPQTVWTDYMNYGQYFTKVGRDTTILLRPTSLLRVGTRQDSLRTPKGKGWNCQYATIFSPADRWVQSDSLYRSSDDGITWSAAEAGLPRDSAGGVIPISSIKRLPNGTLLCAFRGLRKPVVSDTGTADTAIVREGGIWRSTDDGRAWSRSDAGLETDRYVWWIEPLPSGAILAVAGNALYDKAVQGQFLTGWNLVGARIFRSADNGLTWDVVYAETRDRDGYPGRRPILRTSTGSILAATMENGVIESGDDGRTWHEVGEDLYGRMINDIDEDSTGSIWVATDNGIWSWQPTTSVNEPYVNGRYTSVWAYPTPARDEVTIRLNNLNLLTAAMPHLYLYDITGLRRADLTNHVLANRSSERVEFTHSTASLERGVYLLVLDTGSSYETMKLCVWK